MFLKKGDRVRLGINPTIQIAEYQYIKPFVQVERELTGQTDDDIASIEMDLQHLLYKAILVELHVTEEIYDKLAAGGVEALAAFCAKEVGGVIEEEVSGTAKAPASKKAPKKAAKKGGIQGLKKGVKKASKKISG